MPNNTRFTSCRFTNIALNFHIFLPSLLEITFKTNRKINNEVYRNLQYLYFSSANVSSNKISLFLFKQTQTLATMLEMISQFYQKECDLTIPCQYLDGANN